MALYAAWRFRRRFFAQNFIAYFSSSSFLQRKLETSGKDVAHRLSQKLLNFHLDKLKKLTFHEILGLVNEALLLQPELKVKLVLEGLVPRIKKLPKLKKKLLMNLFYLIKLMKYKIDSKEMFVF